MEVAEEVRVDGGGRGSEAALSCALGSGWGEDKDYLPNRLGDEGRGSLPPPTCLPLGWKANDLEGPFLTKVFTAALSSVLGS